MKNNIMLISPKQIKNDSDIDLNVDEVFIGSAIRTAQNIYLRDVIGTELLEYLQELVYNKITEQHPSIEDFPEYKTLLEDYIQPALIYKTIIELTVKISLKLRNIGVVQNSDTNINTSQLTDIRYLKNTYETYYADALNRLMEYLENNRETYGICKCKTLNKYANTKLWLG